MAGDVWFEGLDKIKPYIFKVITPEGYGTGFQVKYLHKDDICAIATAYHVIKQAYEWEEPIKIVHYGSGESKLLRANPVRMDPIDRAVLPHQESDLAIIMFKRQKISSPTTNMRFVPPKKSVKSGAEIGWCGFPSVAQEELCFFAGHISCFLTKEVSYLIDGIAINGVSGGPAFIMSPTTKEVVVCGVMTAYLPNRLMGKTLPGVSFVTSIEPFQKDFEEFDSLEESQEKAQKVSDIAEAAIPKPNTESENSKKD